MEADTTDVNVDPDADLEKIDSFSEKDERRIMVENVAKDYAQYLEVDASKEKEKFNETIEDMLTKLDEFVGLADMIRSDTSLCLMQNLPKIQEKCQEMEGIFEKIDKLEAFVSMVKDNLAVVEENVNKAEDEMGSFSGLKKMLSSFVSPKRSQSKDAKTTAYKPPEIFKTENYFVKQSSEASAKETRNKMRDVTEPKETGSEIDSTQRNESATVTE